MSLGAPRGHALQLRPFPHHRPPRRVAPRHPPAAPGEPFGTTLNHSTRARARDRCGNGLGAPTREASSAPCAEAVTLDGARGAHPGAQARLRCSASTASHASASCAPCSASMARVASVTAASASAPSVVPGELRQLLRVEAVAGCIRRG